MVPLRCLPIRRSGVPLFRGAAILLAVLAISTAPAHAQADFSQGELKSLPRTCLAQKFINGQLQLPVVPEAERRQWEQRLGEQDYSHYHHYCWALIFMRRGNAVRNPNSRAHNFREAIDNLEYVQRNVSPRFPLLPEVYLQKGLVLRLLGDDAGAAREFMTSIQLKNDYTPAYAALVDVHLDLGNYEAADVVLQEGLTHAPNSKILERKKLEIESRSRGTR